MDLPATGHISRRYQELLQGCDDMAYDAKLNKLRRKDAVGMEALVQDFIKDMKLASGVNQQRAVEAWNAVSGAAGYTLEVTLTRGVLYVTLNSSMARNQLYFQRDVLLRRMNEFLDKDQLYVKGDGPAVKNIILK